ncbi:MAG: sulfotransferase family protein [Planctomycetota bacterium]|jgi:hypothetical protein
MADWRWQEQATFLCGHRKAGTTLLLSLLDAHPRLCVFPADSGFFYGYHPVWTEGDFSPQQRLERIIEVMFGTLRTTLEGLPGPEPFPSEALDCRFRREMAGRACTAPELLLGAITAYRDAAGAPAGGSISRWVEKTTSTEIYAGEVFAWFPEARFVHVVRDPRDNYASLKSGWQERYRRHNDSPQRLLQSMMDRGLLGMQMARANVKRFGSERYRVLRYEDLVADPQQVMAGLAGFLEIEWDDGLLRPTCAGRPWLGNNFEGLTFDGPSAVNAGRWPDRIEPQEAALLEFHFAAVMCQWGYEAVYAPAEQADAAREHYKWLNFAQRYSVRSGADTFRRPETAPVAGA